MYMKIRSKYTCTCVHCTIQRYTSSITNLCDVNITLLPSLITPMSTSQRNLLVAGSIPVVGSSRRRIGGLPTSAIAVLNFLLLPPLYQKYHGD